MHRTACPAGPASITSGATRATRRDDTASNLLVIQSLHSDDTSIMGSHRDISPGRSSCAANRRGHVLVAVLTSLATIGGVVAISAFVSPYALWGSEQAHRNDHLSDTQTRVLELVQDTLQSCTAIVAVQARGATPYEELVVWLDDIERPGSASIGEIAVIGHSRVLQTLTLYVPDFEHGYSEDLTRLALDLQGLLDETHTTAAFCTNWRSNPSMRGTVIVRGISDAHFESVVAGPQRGQLEISLTWRTDSADSDVMGTILVDVPGAFAAALE